ncbi:MAG TPA: hypothetical protein VFK68_06445, partial [Propionibacteriaceae bacterium]|nr:hypothetical protein [Propionibacteriaceae bacterium]
MRPAAPSERIRRPRAVLRALAGVAAAAAAVGVGHLVAAFIDPVTSPVVAVGSALVDAAPTPAKEYAVRTFGTADKPILVSAIGLVLVVLAGVVGLMAWDRPRTATVAIGMLGVAGAAAALTRGPLTSAIPSVVAGAAGVAALQVLRTRSVRQRRVANAVDAAAG